MKINNKILVLSLFLVLICFIGTVSAAEDFNETITAGTSIGDVGSVSFGDVGAEYDADGVMSDVLKENIVIENQNIGNSKISNGEVLSGNVVVLYVNGSIDNDDATGVSWDDPACTPSFAEGLLYEYEDEVSECIIYIAKADYDWMYLNCDFDVTFIGYGPDVLLPDVVNFMYGEGGKLTFINLTFKKFDFGMSADFINCTFIDSDLSVNKHVYDDIASGGLTERALEESGCFRTFFNNFDNCVFKDVNTDGALINLYKFGALRFNNCTFENIVADSLVYRNENSYFDEDSVSFKGCNFTNCCFNGVVDSAANFDDAIVIEDCVYGGNVSLGTTEVNGHFYVNTTKLEVSAVGTVISISSNGNNIVVVLKDVYDNPVVGAEVSYTVGDSKGFVRTGVDGSAVVSNLKGVVDITVSYVGNDSFLSSSNSGHFVFKYATSISTFVRGDDVVIALKDVNGNSIANADVNYVVNGVEKVAVTDAKGIITLSGLKGVVGIAVKYIGDDLHVASNASNEYTFKYDTVLTVNEVSATYNVAKNLVVTLKDETGAVMVGKSVTVNVGSISKVLKTNNKGQVSVNVATLVPKIYTASISFGEDALFNAKSTNVKVVVVKATPKFAVTKNKVKLNAKNKLIKVTLKDNKGKALKKTQVSLKINGIAKPIVVKTSNSGVATFNVAKLAKKGTYKGTVKFAGNSYFKVSSKTFKIVVNK